MARLFTPKPQSGEKIRRLEEFLQHVGQWQAKQETEESEDGFLGCLWYRGVNEWFDDQVPGVYRKDFTARAQNQKLQQQTNPEDKRLHLEREMLGQFRSAGATFLSNYSLVDTYFAAQHFGMRTRLLDWSTNPLAGLFFACNGQDEKDGFLYAMDARKVIPPDASMTKEPEILHQAIMTMRHPFVEYAVVLSFWMKPYRDYMAYVLPVRPDVVPGRIGQQSSCFTLHMHNAQDVTNKTLDTFVIDAGSKRKILAELHQLNVNQFTIYYDLDHLSREIKKNWGLEKS